MNSSASALLLHLVHDDREPLRSQIERQLSDRIARGEFVEGQVLPGVRRLAREHRVAPSTVESAYRTLLDEGLLDGDVAGRVTVAALAADRRRDMVENLQIERLVAQELGRRELEMARDVQRRLLPPAEVGAEGWCVAARCQAARVVAGDFYDILHRNDGSVDVVVADVAGKGFAASLIMASVKAMLPFVSTVGGVAECLAELNRRLAAELGRNEFVALTLARYAPDRRIVEIANGGAPDPYLVARDGRVEAIAVPGPRLPLGIRSEVAYASQTTEMPPGTRLLLLTDGLPEALDEGGEPLGYRSLEAMLGEVPFDLEPSNWLAEVFDRLQRRSGRLPEDDWTALMLAPEGADPCS